MLSVRIVGASTDEAAVECSGPTWAGTCAVVRPSQPVACAGHRIEFRAAGLKLRLTVERDATSCPLAPLNVVGHLVPPPRARPGVQPAD
jgi:hypothetical protein